jgi:selenocysteine lyase/cysteine desulfurase
MNWSSIRKEFPALEGRVFLNTATYGQLPARAAEATKTHFEARDRSACSDFLNWFDDVDSLRNSVAAWVGADARDIAFVTNASQALGLVLGGIEWREGDEILTLENEFPNQIYATQSRFGVRGVVCRWDELHSQITRKTRLVLLSTVNYMTGLRPDLLTIVRELRERGILVYLDGTQSVGALGFDCRSIQPDFLAVNAYKWMISPNGAAFLYVRPEVRDWLQPNVIGWRSDQAWRSVECLHQGAPRYVLSAEKYEGGMLNFPSLYAMKASLDLLAEIGSEAIEARVLDLARQLRKGLADMGAEEYPAQKRTLPSQVLSFKFDDADSSRLAKQLEDSRILVSARREYLRISAHFYNNEQDVAALLDALKRAV